MEVKLLVKFDFEDGIHGPAVTLDGTQITRGCAGDGEVEAVIHEMKADLDRVAKAMKRQLKVTHSHA